MRATGAISDLNRILGDTPFGRFALGNFASLTGFWMQRISVGWITWEMTESGGWLGVMAFADLSPALVIGPFAGAAADRMSRIKLMRALQCASAVMATLLSVLYFLDWLALWSLLLLCLCMGSIAAAGQPLRMSIVSELVGREDLGVVVAMNSVVFNVARFVGPAMASLLIVSAGVGAALAAHTVTYLIFLWLLLKLDAVPAVRRSKGSSIGADILEGVRFLATHKCLGPLILLNLAIGVTVRPVAELLPGFAEEVFQSGAAGLAVLSSSIGIGAMVGGLALAGRRNFDGQFAIILTFSVIGCIGVVVFSTVDGLWVGAVVLFVVGVSMVTSGVATLILLQLTVPDHLRGRAVSSYGIINRAGPAFGALILGLISEIVGLRIAVVLGCPICLAAVLWVFAIRRRIQENLPRDDMT